ANLPETNTDFYLNRLRKNFSGELFDTYRKSSCADNYLGFQPYRCEACGECKVTIYRIENRYPTRHSSSSSSSPREKVEHKQILEKHFVIQAEDIQRIQEIAERTHPEGLIPEGAHQASGIGLTIDLNDVYNQWQAHRNEKK
ncbi:MAG: hypothetical protein ACRBBP_11815, partial [Bdellovibrionales bacterium]